MRFRITATVQTPTFRKGKKQGQTGTRTIQVPTFEIDNTTRVDAEKMAKEIINPTGNMNLTLDLTIVEVSGDNS